MRRVLLLATGDLIAWSLRTPGAAVATGRDLLAELPREMSGVTVVAEDVSAEPSWDSSATTMLALARRARTAIVDEGFDGVVVSHGLDTLAESAFLADLLAGPAVHLGVIVFTGALRCRDDPDPDGPANLADAITAAASPALRGSGVLVCLHGELHAARWAHQVDAVRAPAFSSAPFPVPARVAGGAVELLAPAPPRPPAPGGEPESDVALIRTYPGMDPVQLNAVVDAGARGVVLEGTGRCNLPVTLFAAIGDLVEWDIPVVVASRCHTGDAPFPDLEQGAGLAAKVGAIGARGLAADKARMALMVALGSGGMAAVRDWFSRL
ncbi:MAG TPA: asparaginase [Micromonospora sp.]